MGILFTARLAEQCSTWKGQGYWVVQAGLLTPLTFTRHRLRPLFKNIFRMRTFLTIEGGDSDLTKFTEATLKAF